MADTDRDANDTIYTDVRQGPTARHNFHDDELTITLTREHLRQDSIEIAFDIIELIISIQKEFRERERKNLGQLPDPRVADATANAEADPGHAVGDALKTVLEVIDPLNSDEQLRVLQVALNFCDVARGLR